MRLLDSSPKDFLTSFYMKDRILPFLEKCIVEYSVNKSPFAVVMIDIDGFKSFNDKYGHVFGDEAIQYFASSLRLCLDNEDCVIFRFGGDEFVLVFTGMTSKKAFSVANNIESNIKSRPFLFRGREYKTSFSGGVAAYPEDAKEAQILLDRADKAMYFSKKHGRGRVTEYSVMRLAFLQRILNLMSLVIVALFAIIVARDIFGIDLVAWVEYGIIYAVLFARRLAGI